MSIVALRQLALARWRVARDAMIPTERQRLFGLTVVIGGVCGLAAVAFHQAIDLFSTLLIDRALAAPGRSVYAWTLVTPTLGALVAGLLLHHVVPNARGSGVPQVKLAYAMRSGRLRLRDAVGKFFIGALQIGSGSSLGREGPTVQICAGVATWLGRLVGISPRNLRRLLPVGAAAGIAAAFNAPIAAVTFTIEEIVGTLDQTLLSGVIVAAALAAVVERSVLGQHPVFEIPVRPALESAPSLLLYAVLGVAAGLVSVVFTQGLLRVRAAFARMHRLPPWARPALGGLATGALALVALELAHTQGITGGGYPVLAQALSGGVVVKTLVLLGVLKLVATVMSYSSGGAGGIFAPSLFIGAMLGGAVGYLDVAAFGHDASSIGSFALVGMGAMFAGAIRAPMTSVLIIVEMTAGYSLILPLMIANMVAYGLARLLQPAPIYEALIEQDGIHLGGELVPDVLDGVLLGDFALDESPFVSLSVDSRGAVLLEATRGAGRQQLFPVVDGTHHLLGLITLEDLTVLAGEPGLENIVHANDLMRRPVSVTRQDEVHTAFERMRAHGLRELPILDEEGRVTAFVDEVAIAHAYLQARGATARSSG